MRHSTIVLRSSICAASCFAILLFLRVFVHQPEPLVVHQLARPIPSQAAPAQGLSFVSTRPTSSEAEKAEPQLHPFPLPDRKHIFADFPAYSWPNRSVLLAEVWTAQRFDDPSTVSKPAQVSFAFPCVSSPVQLQSPKAIKIYVPWKSKTFMSPDPIQCPIRCELTNHVEDIPKVDAFLVDTLGAMINEPYNWTLNKYGKLLVAFNTENIEGRRPVLKKGYGIRYLAKPWTDEWWNSFNIVVSYHWASMVMIPFLQWANCREDIVRPAISRLYGSKNVTKVFGKLSLKTKSAEVLFFARNCDFVMHRRQGFVKQLIQAGLRIDSVGKCLNSKSQEEVSHCSGMKGNRRLCLIGAYAFYLSIENSISLDYVSEKLYEPLLVGTIPIYLGAPNVENFLPTSHSAILAVDFSSIKQLVNYVQCVHRTPRLYEHYTAWRTRPLYRSFVDRLHRQYSPLCQVCQLILRNDSAMYDVSRRRPRALNGVFEANKGGQEPFKECLR